LGKEFEDDDGMLVEKILCVFKISTNLNLKYKGERIQL